MPNGRVFQDFSAVPWGLFSWSRDSLSCAFRIQKAVPRVNKNPEVTASNPPLPPTHTHSPGIAACRISDPGSCWDGCRVQKRGALSQWVPLAETTETP